MGANMLKYCLSALFEAASSLPFAVIIHQKWKKKKKKFKLQDYVALKINKMEKETPLHPNVLLAQIEELEGDCAKIITKFGFITTSRLRKIEKKKQIFYFIIQREITLTRAYMYKMASNQ